MPDRVTETALLNYAVRRCFAVPPGQASPATTLARAAMAVGVPEPELRERAMDWAARKSRNGRLDYELAAAVFGVSAGEIRAQLLARRQADSRGRCRRCKQDRELGATTGLCRRCRERGRKKSPPQARGRGLSGGHRPLDPTPCPHPPGTEGKLAALEYRAANRLSLWHPDDAEYDGAAVAVKLWAQLLAEMCGRGHDGRD